MKGLAALVLLAAFLAALGAWDGPVRASAGNFSPATTLKLCAYSGGYLETTCSSETRGAGANADMTTTFGLQAGQTSAASLVGFSPAGATVGAPRLGAVVGRGVVNPLSLGLLNNACSNTLAVAFPLMNATVDNSLPLEYVSLPPQAADEEGPLEPFRDDGDGNKLPRHVDRYPAFLNKLFDPDRVGDIDGDGDEFDTVGGVAENPGASPLDWYGSVEPLQPLARYSGSTLVAGQAYLFQIIVFSPGALAAFSPPHPLSDLGAPALGYPAIAVVNDPTADPWPGPVSDACSPTTTTIVLWGKTRDNPCLGGTCANDDTPCFIDCGSNVAINSFEGSSPAFNESDSAGPCNSTDTAGCVRYANPSTAGTHFFYVYQQSQRDADNDGIENSLDTCPLTATSGYNPRADDPVDDPDLDRIPGPGGGGCDTVSNSGNDNQDGDTIGGSAWVNAQDNCPLVSNGDQAESERVQKYTVAAKRGGPKTDGIGDACESNDTVANGHFHTVLAAVPKCIGGTDNDGDGWCTQATSFPYGAGSASLSDPNGGNASVTPEHYALFVPLPVTHSGSGDAPPGSREPSQVCSDGVDNDGDGLADIADSGCRPPIEILITEPEPGAYPDTDDDGFSDELEIYLGTDVLGRCEVGGSIAVPSSDWPADMAGGDDSISINDLSAFLTPVYRLFNGSGGANWSQRYDLAPDADINIGDLTVVTNLDPPMDPFNGGPAYFGPPCTPHPAYGD